MLRRLFAVFGVVNVPLYSERRIRSERSVAGIAEVYVFPLQPQQLALPQPARDSHGVQPFETVPACRFE